jgi:hypothetical protein
VARPALLILAALWPCACGSDPPVYVGGDYTIAVTARENGCGFGNWTPGATASNIQLQILQSPGSPSLSGTIQGGTGFLVQVLLGTNAFTGRVSGNQIEALLVGTNMLSQGTCQYRIQVDLKGDLSGDVLTGTIDYSTSTDHSSACGALEGCHSVQDFNGTRPPTSR